MFDETGCWGQCVDCGKRFGFVSRRVLASYADLIETQERHRAVVRSEMAGGGATSLRH
jgi:D-alanyl-D-alanine dipeptidase